MKEEFSSRCYKSACLLLGCCFLGRGNQYSQRGLISFLSMFFSDSTLLKLKVDAMYLPDPYLSLIAHGS